MADTSGNVRDLAASCKLLGQLYWIKNKTEEACQFLMKSIDHYLELEDIEEVEEIKKEFDI